MMSVLQRAGVLLKVDEAATEFAVCDVVARPKNFQKIFGNAFDKAEKCAIVYITRLIPALFPRHAGVIIERAQRWTV